MPITITYDNNIYSGTIILHKPYWGGADGSLSFSNTNMSFKSGRYASYIDDIDDEYITITGYEDTSAMSIFVLLGELADDGVPISLNNLKNSWNGTYIIQSFSYKPIGLSTFEYRLILKYVDSTIIVPQWNICLPVCWANGRICGY